MDTRRLRLLGLARFKMKYLLHLAVDRRDWRNARSYVWTTLFSRDSGMALQDLFYRSFPHLGPYPQQLEIEVTTACNLKCTICEHTYWTERPRHMTFQQFRTVINQFPRLRWVGMTGIGSGFLNPDYLNMLNFLKREKHCFVEFFDHFYMLDRDISRELVDMGMNKIFVSLESATKESYERIRVGSDFDRVLQNLRDMVSVKREKRSPIPELWFHFIMNKHNIDEMEAYVDLVADLVKEERRLSAPVIYWTRLIPFDEVEDLRSHPSGARMSDIEKKCRDKGIYAVINENVECDKPMTSCAKWNEPFVLVSGHIQPCCALNEANDRSYQVQNAFANVFESDFRIWWRSPAKTEFINRLKSGRVNPVCKNCHIFKHPLADLSVSIRDYERARTHLLESHGGDSGKPM